MKKILLFVSIIFIDQLTKYFAIQSLLPELGGFLKQTTVCNQFLAWGIPLGKVWLVTLWLAIMGIFIWLAAKTKWNIFLVMVLAGAFSNFIDRARFSCVVDFIQVGNFPTFNVADVFITIGIVLFVVQVLRKKEDKIKT